MAYQARQKILDIFLKEIEERKSMSKKNDGSFNIDFITKMLQAEDEDGEKFTDEVIPQPMELAKKGFIAQRYL